MKLINLISRVFFGLDFSNYSGPLCIIYFIQLPEGVGTTTTFFGVMATCGGSEGVAEVVVELTIVAGVGTAKKLTND